MKITNEIRKKKNSFSIEKDKLVFAIISSIFSVLFSLSIVFELSNHVGGIVLIILTLFTIIFLVANETIKVREVRKYYNGVKGAVLPAMITFIISFSLSGIGVYLWTNNSLEATNEIRKEVVNNTNSIQKQHLTKIQEINNKSFESTKQYDELNNTLKYWKGKSAASLDERNSIRNHIKDIESDINVARTDFNNKNQEKIDNINKMMSSDIEVANTKYKNDQAVLQINNVLSSIFFIMIFVTEIGIVVLNKELALHDKKISDFAEGKQAEYYIICRKLLESLYLSNKKGKVSIQDALYSPVMNKLDWDDNKKWREVKKQYNVLINIGILSNSKIVKKGNKEIITNNINQDQKESFNKFDCYFEKLLTM